MRIRTTAPGHQAAACRHAEHAVLTDRRVRTADAVPPVLSVAALVLAGVTPVHYVLEPGRASLLVAAVCGSLALVFAVARASLRCRPVQAFVRRHPDDVVLAACVLASVAAATELFAFARPVSAGGLVVFLLATGVLVVRRRDAVVVSAAVLTEWFAVACWQGFTGAWGPLSVLVVCAAVVAHVLEVIRRRATDHLARAESVVLEAAVTDELTGLRNRRGLVAAGEHQLRDHPREALSVAYVDLDGLKRTNDEQGHAAGDRVLRTAATVLSRSTRPTDVVARLGGDEFAVLLPDTAADDARLARHRLERALATAGVRASVGTATSVVSPDPAQALKALLDQADAAMYAEKQRRRTAPATALPAQRERPAEEQAQELDPLGQRRATDRLVHLPTSTSTAALDLLGLARVAAWLHVALVPAHVLLLPTGPGRVMVGVSLAVAALCFAIASRPLRAEVTGRAEALMCLIMITLCAETVGYSALAPERWASLATVLALVSAGGTLAGPTRVAGVCGATTVGWLAVELRRGLDAETPSYVIPVLSGLGLAVLLHVVHHRTLARLETAEAQVRAIALTDELTGLPNRRAFLAAGRPLVELSLRRGEHASVLFLDLDGLKRVNDELGHAAGDRLLATAAGVLRRSVTPSDLVGRLAGDEFTVLLHGCAPDQVPTRVAWLETSLEQQGISASIGVAHLDRDTPSLDALVDRADAAMLLVKQGRRHASHPTPSAGAPHELSP